MITKTEILNAFQGDIVFAIEQGNASIKRAIRKAEKLLNKVEDNPNEERTIRWLYDELEYIGERLETISSDIRNADYDLFNWEETEYYYESQSE